MTEYEQIQYLIAIELHRTGFSRYAGEVISSRPPWAVRHGWTEVAP